MEQLRDTKENYPVLDHRVIWSGPIFSLHADHVDLGVAQVERQYLYHPGAVAVVAYREDSGRGQVLLLNQYRHPVRSRLWEIPAGLLDKPGEPWVVAAQRELAEEADLQAKQWDVLVDYYTSPGASDESLRIYLAREVSEIAPAQRSFVRTEEEAQMSTRWVDLDQAVRAVLAGDIHNPSACVGILALNAAVSQDFESVRPVASPWEIDRRSGQVL